MLQAAIRDWVRRVWRAGTAVPWTLKIEKTGVMDLISVEEVNAKLDTLLAAIKAAKIPS